MFIQRYQLNRTIVDATNTFIGFGSLQSTFIIVLAFIFTAELSSLPVFRPLTKGAKLPANPS